jgi:hypothetical protein
MRLRPILLLALLALPAAAAAQYDPDAPPPPVGRPSRAAPPRSYGPADTGLVLGARLGYGSPGGKISNEDPRLDDLIDSKIPIWLELGYRFNPTVRGGLYLELAPMSVNDTFCLPGRSCDAGSVRFGIDVQFHLSPFHPVDPWIGAGIGAEFISADAYDPTIDDISTFGYGGVEFPLLEAGVDLTVSPRFALGPYVSWSAGRFTSYSVSSPGFADTSGRIQSRATHSWFQIGVKGTFKL